MNGISYQNERRMRIEEPSQINFATVMGVYEDGLQLKFDGEKEATSKRYRYNKSITFQLGDRVKVMRVSGTYVVEYPIGKGKITLPPGNVSEIKVFPKETSVGITWKDPENTMINGHTVSRWAGTYLVRNEFDFPKNEKDGTLVLNNQTRNAYLNTPFEDSGLVPNKKYYCALFPYSDEGKVNYDTDNTFTAQPIKILKYGVKIDQNNADPDTRVEYIFDAVGMRPGRLNQETETFDYGDWTEIGFIKDNKPCMLKLDGTVDYYLDPNNYNLKEDGTPSDASNINYNGNVMAEMPRWYLCQYSEGGYDYIILSEQMVDDRYQALAFTDSRGIVKDKIYLGTFPSSAPAKSIKGAPYIKYKDYATAIKEHESEITNLTSWSERDYVAALLIVLSKSTDFSACFGGGFVTVESDSQFNKETIFHIKQWWGQAYAFVAGIYTKYSTEQKESQTCIKMHPPYNATGEGHQTLDKYYLPDKEGWISRIKITEFGKLASLIRGSETTYFTSKYHGSPASFLYPISPGTVSEDQKAIGIAFMTNKDHPGRISAHP